MRQLLIAAMMVLPADAVQLRITVYDQAHLPNPVSKAAFEMVGQIFRESAIDVELVPGDLESAEASLVAAAGMPRPGTEREASCRARRDIALEIVAQTPPTRGRTILGMAEPFAREGLNARVFYDHVQDAAARENRDPASVLAHAIAHEIGHVLLRTTSHIPVGLMSAVWSDREYGWMSRSMLFFTREQGKVMRDVLRGTNCDVTLSTKGLASRPGSRL